MCDSIVSIGSGFSLWFCFNFSFRLQQKSVSINEVLIEFDRNSFRSDSSSFWWLAHGHHLQCKKSEIQTSTSHRTYITYISQFTLSSFCVHIFDYVIIWMICKFIRGNQKFIKLRKIFTWFLFQNLWFKSNSMETFFHIRVNERYDIFTEFNAIE